MKKEITIRSRDLNYQTESGRISFDLDGALLYFESDDVDLVCRSETAASLAMVVSLYTFRRVFVKPRLCSEFYHNLISIRDLWKEWWPERRVGINRFRSRRRWLRGRGEPTKGRTAMFFSLGVDSFHTLYECPDVDTLICVHGFDVDIANHSLFEFVERDVRLVGEALGKRSIIIRTNLRSHPLYVNTNWLNWCGAAMASIAHMLPDEYTKVMIASSFSKSDLRPSGSQWFLDQLWSSVRLKVAHHGESFERSDKIRLIRGDRIVQKYLRVCWTLSDSNGANLNCGKCEKCVRTLVALLNGEKFVELECFPPEIGIVASLDALECLPEHAILYYKEMYAAGLPNGVAQSVLKLIDRSQVALGLRS